MKKIVALMLASLFVSLNATISLMNPKKDWISFCNLFKQIYPLDTFIESGTYLGQTAAQAAHCFNEVHTVEVSEYYYHQACENLKKDTHVTVYHNDSAQLFPHLLPKLKQQRKKMLFWLDGHFMSCMIGEQDNVLLEYGYTPIEQELAAINETAITDAIILIDDIRLFGTQLYGLRIERAGNAHYPLIRDIVKLMEQHQFNCMIFGDVICIHPQSVDIPFSPVIQACTISRLYDGTNYAHEDVLHAEQVIAQATGHEQDALYDLYVSFSKPWKSWRNRSPHYNLWYGLMALHNGDHKKACRQFEEVIDLGYDHWRVYWYLAQSLMQIHDIEGAQDVLQRVLAQKPDFQQAKALLAQVEISTEGAKNRMHAKRTYDIPEYPGFGPRDVYYLTGVGDNFFKEELVWGNQDGWSKPYKALRDAYVSKGYRFLTSLPKNMDNAFRDNAYVIFRHNIPPEKERKQLGSAVHKMVVLSIEPPFVYPNNYKHEFTRHYNRILTWDDKRVDNRRFFKYIFVQSNLTMIDDVVPFNQKKLCTFIGGNHNYKHPNELYSQRRAAINFFEKHAPKDFDFYGNRWDPKAYKTYRGRVQSKTATFKKYKFAVCYENLSNHKGYISEKVFGVFVAGCVPIYWGAVDVTNYIPASCFIDRRKFANFQEVYDYISTMPEEAYNQYLENIRAYLNSEAVQIFSIDYFIDTLARLAEYKLPRLIEPWAINFEDQSLFCVTED